MFDITASQTSSVVRIRSSDDLFEGLGGRITILGEGLERVRQGPELIHRERGFYDRHIPVRLD